MQLLPVNYQTTTSPRLLWTGRILSGLLVTFFLFEAVTKIFLAAPVVDATEKLGWPVSTVRGIGATLLVCSVIYVIPRTAILGAILLTGYLGGAVATHVRAQTGAFPVAFSALFGALTWVGLVLREPRLFRLILGRRWGEDSTRYT